MEWTKLALSVPVPHTDKCVFNISLKWNETFLYIDKQTVLMHECSSKCEMHLLLNAHEHALKVHCLCSSLFWSINISYEVEAWSIILSGGGGSWRKAVVMGKWYRRGPWFKQDLFTDHRYWTMAVGKIHQSFTVFQKMSPLLSVCKRQFFQILKTCPNIFVLKWGQKSVMYIKY
jgi:hypothetical protein